MTPLPAISVARFNVMLSRPALLTLYALPRTMPDAIEAALEMLRIRPQPCESMTGRQACIRWNAPMRLMAIDCVHTSGSTSTIGLAPFQNAEHASADNRARNSLCSLALAVYYYCGSVSNRESAYPGTSCRPLPFCMTGNTSFTSSSRVVRSKRSPVSNMK
jgi:hypothetical protein